MYKNKFLVSQIVLLISTFLLIHLLLPIHGHIDLQLIKPWIDADGHFFLKDHWALKVLAHKYVKYILISVYSYFLFAFLASYYFKSLEKYRLSYLYFFFMVILSTSIIGIMKSQSNYACPWDIVMPTAHGYLWNFNQVSGHCFPGGHASTGFALVAGYFLYRQNHRALAYFYLFSSLILGFGLGWGQMMRGAHFFSHNVWSAWIIWCLNFIVYAVLKYKLKAKFLNGK